MKKLRRLCNRKGLTLIELIVAIAVLAILASTAGLAIASIARQVTESNCKDATRNYFSLTRAAMNQLNSGASVYSNGPFTANDDISVLLKRTTGYTPQRLVRLDDSQDATSIRPFNSDEEGYYVGIRYADPSLSYPIKSTTEVSEADREFFVDSIYFISQNVCYECLRQNSDIKVYR